MEGSSRQGMARERQAKTSHNGARISCVRHISTFRNTTSQHFHDNNGNHVSWLRAKEYRESELMDNLRSDKGAATNAAPKNECLLVDTV